MGKADVRGRGPPVQNFRNKVGAHNAKLGKKENKETEQQALAKKQPDPFPAKQILLYLAIFGAVCALLFAYLNYILADDEDDLVDLVPKKKPAAAAAADAG